VDLAAPGARDRVAPADPAAPVGLVSRADQVMDMAATGRVAPAVTAPAVPAGTIRVVPDRAVRASPEDQGNLADPAATIRVDLAARGRMVRLPRGQAPPDLTPTVPDRAHLDLRPGHLDRVCPAGPDPTRRRQVATVRAAAMLRQAQARPADRTLRLGATPQAVATHPAEVTDPRPKSVQVTAAFIPRPLPFRVPAGAESPGSVNVTDRKRLYRWRFDDGSNG